MKGATPVLKWENLFIDADEIMVIVPIPIKEMRVRKGPIVARSRKPAVTVVDLDSEESIGQIGEVGKVVPATSRNKTGVTRKDPTEHPPCPHCGGKMHWNQAGATVNFECMWRQYCLAQGTMSAPNDRLPIFTDEDMDGFVEWKNTRKRSRKNPLSYGRMPSEKGFGTYSAMKAASVKSVKDAAEEVEVKTKTKKSKKSKTQDETPTIPIKTGKTGKKSTPIQETATVKSGKARKANKSEPVNPAKPVKTGKVSKKSAPVEDSDFIDLDMIEDDEPVAVARKSKSAKASKTGKSGKIKSGKAKSKRAA